MMFLLSVQATAQDGALAAGTPSVVTSCATGSGKEAIAGCTEEIRSGHLTGLQLAHAYARRATARYLQKQYAGAIADYTEAIRLDRDHSHTYMRDRGFAW
jgi:hypothetical protein